MLRMASPTSSSSQASGATSDVGPRVRLDTEARSGRAQRRARY